MTDLDWGPGIITPEARRLARALAGETQKEHLFAETRECPHCRLRWFVPVYIHGHHGYGHNCKGTLFFTEGVATGVCGICGQPEKAFIHVVDA